MWSGQEIFCDHETKYKLGGELAGKRDTLVGHKPQHKSKG